MIHRHVQNKNLYFAIIGLIILGCHNDSKSKLTKTKSSENQQETISKKTEDRQESTVSVKLDSVEISKMTDDQLWKLRNEIFASHGYIFKNKELSNYFSKFAWYKPTTTVEQINEKLTEIDKINIKLIKSIESSNEESIDKNATDFPLYLNKIPYIDLP